VLGELRRWPDYRQTVEQLKQQLERDDVLDDWTTVLQQHDVPRGNTLRLSADLVRTLER